MSEYPSKPRNVFRLAVFSFETRYRQLYVKHWVRQPSTRVRFEVKSSEEVDGAIFPVSVPIEDPSSSSLSDLTNAECKRTKCEIWVVKSLTPSVIKTIWPCDAMIFVVPFQLNSERMQKMRRFLSEMVRIVDLSSNPTLTRGRFFQRLIILLSGRFNQAGSGLVKDVLTLTPSVAREAKAQVQKVLADCLGTDYSLIRNDRHRVIIAERSNKKGMSHDILGHDWRHLLCAAVMHYCLATDDLWTRKMYYFACLSRESPLIFEETWFWCKRFVTLEHSFGSGLMMTEDIDVEKLFNRELNAELSDGDDDVSAEDNNDDEQDDDEDEDGGGNDDLVDSVLSHSRLSDHKMRKEHSRMKSNDTDDTMVEKFSDDYLATEGLSSQRTSLASAASVLVSPTVLSGEDDEEDEDEEEDEHHKQRLMDEVMSDEEELIIGDDEKSDTEVMDEQSAVSEEVLSELETVDDDNDDIHHDHIDDERVLVNGEEPFEEGMNMEVWCSTFGLPMGIGRNLEGLGFRHPRELLPLTSDELTRRTTKPKDATMQSDKLSNSANRMLQRAIKSYAKKLIKEYNYGISSKLLSHLKNWTSKAGMLESRMMQVRREHGEGVKITPEMIADISVSRASSPAAGVAGGAGSSSASARYSPMLDTSDLFGNHPSPGMSPLNASSVVNSSNLIKNDSTSLLSASPAITAAAVAAVNSSSKSSSILLSESRSVGSPRTRISPAASDDKNRSLSVQLIPDEVVKATRHAHSRSQRLSLDDDDIGMATLDSDFQERYRSPRRRGVGSRRFGATISSFESESRARKTSRASLLPDGAGFSFADDDHHHSSYDDDSSNVQPMMDYNDVKMEDPSVNALLSEVKAFGTLCDHSRAKCAFQKRSLLQTLDTELQRIDKLYDGILQMIKQERDMLKQQMTNEFEHMHADLTHRSAAVECGAKLLKTAVSRSMELEKNIERYQRASSQSAIEKSSFVSKSLNEQRNQLENAISHINGTLLDPTVLSAATVIDRPMLEYGSRTMSLPTARLCFPFRKENAVPFQLNGLSSVGYVSSSSMISVGELMEAFRAHPVNSSVIGSHRPSVSPDPSHRSMSATPLRSSNNNDLTGLVGGTVRSGSVGAAAAANAQRGTVERPSHRDGMLLEDVSDEKNDQLALIEFPRKIKGMDGKKHLIKPNECAMSGRCCFITNWSLGTGDERRRMKMKLRIEVVKAGEHFTLGFIRGKHGNWAMPDMRLERPFETQFGMLLDSRNGRFYTGKRSTGNIYRGLRDKDCLIMEIDLNQGTIYATQNQTAKMVQYSEHSSHGHLIKAPFPTQCVFCVCSLRGVTHLRIFDHDHSDEAQSTSSK